MSSPFRWIQDIHKRARVSRTVHAIPYAATGAHWARDAFPTTNEIILLTLCLVFARAVLVGFQNLFQAPTDVASLAIGPPDLLPQEPTPKPIHLLFALHGAAMLFLCAWYLSPVAAWWSLPLSTLVALYAWVRRYTGLSHALTGVILGSSPLAAWLALQGNLDVPLSIACFGGGTILWATGLDLVFSLQRDLRKGDGPGRFEGRMAMAPAQVRWVARTLHLTSLGAFALAGHLAGLGWPWWTALIPVAVLLVTAHVRIGERGFMEPHRLRTFLRLNLAIGPLLFLATLVHQTL